MIDGPLFSIGKLHFWPYGLCMGMGIICCFVFLLVTMTKKNFNDEAIEKILVIGALSTGFGIFMAALVQGIYNAIAGKGFNFDGMTFLGGLFGGVIMFVIVWNIYVYLIAPRTKIKLLQNNMNVSITDAMPFIPIGITIAHAFGRLGCVFSGCCHGAQTDAWYGIYMYTVKFGYVKVVPIQLFECIFLVLLTLVMVLLYFKFNFKYNFSLYCIAYGVWRIIIEIFRADDRGEIFHGSSLSPSQVLSIIMLIVGLGLIFLHKYKLLDKMKHPELQPPVREKKVKATAGTGSEAVNEEAADRVDCPTDMPQSTPDLPENKQGENGENQGQ